MLRCKKGDLAIVLTGDNAGRIVEVLDYVGLGSTDKGVFRDLWLISWNGQLHNPITGGRWLCQDWRLLPIRPGDLKETDEKEVESVG